MIDEEEAKYQEQKTKEAIEKAKTQLYFQTERVKGLHVGINEKILCLFYMFNYLLVFWDTEILSPLYFHSVHCCCPRC